MKFLIFHSFSLAQMFSCEFCKIFKNSFLKEHLWATACGDPFFLLLPQNFSTLKLKDQTKFWKSGRNILKRNPDTAQKFSFPLSIYYPQLHFLCSVILIFLVADPGIGTLYMDPRKDFIY